jgi:hypothetical protein
MLLVSSNMFPNDDIAVANMIPVVDVAAQVTSVS